MTSLASLYFGMSLLSAAAHAASPLFSLRSQSSESLDSRERESTIKEDDVKKALGSE
jgi:hypothetical protein